MIEREYRDFDDLFFSLNKEIASKEGEFIESYSGKQNAYINPLALTAKSYGCTIDIGSLCYHKNKFNKLIDSYVDIDSLMSFIEKIQRSKGTSLTYYFKQNKPKKGTSGDNGPCLISIVFTRPTRNQMWNKAFIYYRTSELNRRFGADLVLFNKIMRMMPECVSIDSVTILIPKSYIGLKIYASQCNMFNYSMPEGKLKEAHEYNIKCLSNEKLSKYKAQARIQRYWQGLETWPSISVDELEIKKKEKQP